MQTILAGAGLFKVTRVWWKPVVLPCSFPQQPEAYAASRVSVLDPTMKLPLLDRLAIVIEVRNTDEDKFADQSPCKVVIEGRSTIVKTGRMFHDR